MVDLAVKPATRRIAVATGRITIQPATLALIESGTAKKGDCWAWPASRALGCQEDQRLDTSMPPLRTCSRSFPLDCW